MKHIFHLIFLITILLLQSCSCSSEHPQEPLNDVYRVEVRTYLNVRATPSKKSAIRGTLADGTLVDVLDISDGWARISLRGEEIGYVSSDYIVLVREGRNHQEAGTMADSGNEDISPDTESVPAADYLTEAKHEEESVQHTSEPLGNVRFIGDSTILTAYDKDIIVNHLSKSQNYIYIVNTVESVPALKIYDYSPDLFDEVVKDYAGISPSWWESIKSSFGWKLPSSNIVLLSYIKECGLLQAECNSTSLKYLKMSTPEEYFRLQEIARHDLATSIYEMGLAIETAGQEYESRSWFIKGQVNTGNFFNIICDDLLVQNILPKDSFWHKWIFGWIFAIPLSVANWLFVLTGSYLGSLFLIMLIIVGLHYIVSYRIFKYGGAPSQAWITICVRLVNLFMWLCMLSLVIYMIPDMTNIAVMEQSGFSNSVTSLAIKVGLDSAISKNWLLIAMYWIGSLIYMGVNAVIALNATLPDKEQVKLFDANKDNPELKNEIGDAGETLSKSSTPYTDLLILGFGKEELGQSLPPSILLSFVLSGSIIFYTCLFIWTVLLKRAVFFLNGVLFYKRRGLYYIVSGS